MTDFTDELRKMANCTMFITPEAGAKETGIALRKAADEIDSLREQEKRLVEALKQCREAVRRPQNAGEQTVELITRQALKEYNQ